mmetsp:Transcript_753/g.1751  ORF Transcript_753/g.1751 Transcript_753/m.1751 type:complete len:133 (+) Transcript_753:1668-2066(+)
MPPVHIGVPEIYKQHYSDVVTVVLNAMLVAVIKNDALALFPLPLFTTCGDEAPRRHLNPKMSSESSIGAAAMRSKMRPGMKQREERFTYAGGSHDSDLGDAFKYLQCLGAPSHYFLRNWCARQQRKFAPGSF